jgi:hypothetical protein
MVRGPEEGLQMRKQLRLKIVTCRADLEMCTLGIEVGKLQKVTFKWEIQESEK